LAVQFAAKMGFRVAAIARGADKADFARRLVAAHYIDSQAQDVAGALARLGGARAVISTVTDAVAMASVIDGLSADGRLMVLGSPGEPVAVWAHLLLRGRSILGSAGGTAIESEDAMAFSSLIGARPIIETLPIERAAEAYEKMMSGRARFRMVLTTGL
jgi:D-arabinose 1-dehydrogenase-like Zn-dependent alcohol dehydrogenase